MSMHKGFGFHRHHDGIVSIYAQDFPETGAWTGAGHVGSMPNLPFAKSYVDWLQEVGPEAARVADIPTGAIPGYLVTVPAGKPDGDAHLLDLLDRIAANISVDLGKEAYWDLHSQMTRAVHAIEIANDGQGAAYLIGEDILKPAASDGMYRLTFRETDDAGTLSSSDAIVVGIGTGWIGRFEDRLAVARAKALATLPSDKRYARSVFVEGAELSVGRDAIQHLQEVAKALASSAGRWTNEEYRGKVVDYVKARLPQVMDGIRASLEPDGPAFR